MNKKESDQFFGKVIYGLNLEAERKKRLDPSKQKDYQVECKLLADLNAIGYFIRYSFEIEKYPFTKEDTTIVPVITDYFGKFENHGMEAALCDTLGVKGLFAATEPLIKRYYDLRPPNYTQFIVMSIAQSLLEIKNPNYVSEYIQMISDEDYRPEDLNWIIEMLGKLKAREAIPQMLDLLHIEPYGTYMWNEKQYQIIYECIRALAKFNDRSLIPYLEPFLEPEKLPQFILDREWPEPDYPLKEMLKDVKSLAEKSIARILKYGK